MSKEKMKLNPEVVDDVEKAIYQARWVDAYSKTPVLATDRELAEAAIAAVYTNLQRKFL